MNPTTTRRNFVAASAAALAAAAVSTPAAAQGKPDGTVEITLWRAGFIIGGSGGSGTLEFKNNGYLLAVGGVSIGATIGVARIEFVGEVYNLKQASDIEGTYTAVGASGAIAGGAGVAELQNSRGVKLRLSGRQIGLMASIDLSGMQITIRK